eukprot:CAMPEP_0116068602 /NCGR_PEP_ID=MMETSP0322-20121206/11764_1 /TAXON_ID=163516 /ORGANISM="Leptocylindrus danicus var. apora, Strain B651" /LENGTH=283 /DNA_ID=CAMNT_0003555755 /DNA_START=3 /DNA_END=854 /DNA_ORIENTATION=+
MTSQSHDRSTGHYTTPYQAKFSFSREKGLNERKASLNVDTHSSSSPPLSLFATPSIVDGFHTGSSTVTSPLSRTPTSLQSFGSSRKFNDDNIADESPSRCIARMKGDLHLLKALSFMEPSSPSSARGTQSIRKKLFEQLERRLSMVENFVSNSPSSKGATFIRANRSPNLMSATKEQNGELPFENESLRQRLDEFRRYTTSSKEQSTSAINSEKNFEQRCDKELSVSTKSVDEKIVRNSIENIKFSPGQKFVAELSGMINIEEGHHAILADILDRQFQKQNTL